MFNQRLKQLFYDNSGLRLANYLYPKVLKPQMCLMPYQPQRTPQRTALLKTGKIMQEHSQSSLVWRVNHPRNHHIMLIPTVNTIL